MARSDLDPDTDQAPEPPDDQSPDDARPDSRLATARRLLRKRTLWFVGVVFTAIIGIVVSWNLDAIKTWWSAREPLDIVVTQYATHGPGWSMVVPDPSRLPANIEEINDCDTLQDVGLAAGGLSISEADQQFLLTGHAQDGVTIRDLRAVVDSRQAPVNGALLECPTAGEVRPMDVQFTFGDGVDSAEAQIRDPNGRNSEEFNQGLVVDVKQNEPVTFKVATQLPAQSVSWHIEADIRVGGTDRTIRIDNHGNDFVSGGTIDYNSYDEGPGGGVFQADWGIDKDAGVHKARGGATEWLAIGNVNFPNHPGLNIYHPYVEDSPLDLTARTTQRWLRDGPTKLVEIYPNRDFKSPADGDPCVVGGVDSLNSFGQVYLLQQTGRTLKHTLPNGGSDEFDHTTYVTDCSQGLRDGLPGTPGFATCGGVPCVEQQQVIEVARLVQATGNLDTQPVLVTRLSEVPDAKRPVAEEMLDSAVIGYDF